MTEFVRGATIRIAATFKDADGVTVTPDAAEIIVRYIDTTGTAVEVTSAMLQDGSTFYYEWDSRPAKPGSVTFHTRTDDGLPIAAKDGSFRLAANKANPDPT